MEEQENPGSSTVKGVSMIYERVCKSHGRINFFLLSSDFIIYERLYLVCRAEI